MGIPRGIHERHKYVVVTADVMFVNGILFLDTLFEDQIIHVQTHTQSKGTSAKCAFEESSYFYMHGENLLYVQL